MSKDYPHNVDMHIKSDTLIGKDGYIFLWQGPHRQFDYLTRVLIPTRSSQANFFDNIRSRKQYLQKNGIQFKHIVFPSKPVIYYDKLPCNLKVDSLFERKYKKSQFVYYARKKLLSRKSQGRRIFRKFSPYLTDYGFLSCFKDAFPKDFKLLKESGYTFKDAKPNDFNNLSQEIDSRGPDVVTDLRLDPIDPYGSNIHVEVTDNINGSTDNSDNVIVIRSYNSIKSERLLIFGDSFIRQALHLLTPIYSEIIYFESHIFRPEIVSVLKPHIVLTSNAEIYLSDVKNDLDTDYWCLSNFNKGQSLNSSTRSLRLLYHLRGLSSRYFDEDRYENYLLETSHLLRAKNHPHEKSIVEWLARPRQVSSSEYILKKLKLKDIDSSCKIKFIPVEQTDASNGSIRSLARRVFRGEIKEIYRSSHIKDHLLKSYEPRILAVLCLLRIENILSESKRTLLDEYEGSELYCSCHLLADLLTSGTESLREVIMNDVNKLLDQESKVCLLELFKACYLFRPYFVMIKHVLPNLISSVDNRNQNMFKSYFCKINDSNSSSVRFVDLIQGKSVAIVGPSSCGQLLGHEIDKYDTVIRMSVDNLSNLDESVSGLKTSIIYFSSHIKNCQENVIALSDSVPFVSISLPRFAPLLFDKHESKFPHVRKTVNIKAVSNLQKYSSPNLLQVILVDILRYNPRGVKVFYSNMFARKTYDSNYKSVELLRQNRGKTEHYSLSSLTMINHDPIANYFLVKSLYKNKLIDADPILAEVLRMSSEQYLDSLKSNITITQIL